MTGESCPMGSRWVMIGDVGGAGGFHVGDEAMLSANIDLLRATIPNASIVVVSAAPGFTSAKYGVEAVAVDRLDTPEGATRTLADVDGLLISGGGNLQASWPHHIRRRVALMREAHRRELPVIVTGQGIGPELAEADRAALAEVLPHANLVGVRDPGSHRLARALGVPNERLRYQPDDAFGLVSPATREPGQHIVASLHPFCDPVRQAARFGLMVDQLASLSARTGLPLRFVPQVGFHDPAGDRGDGAFGRALARALAARAPMEVLPIADVATSPSQIVNARLVVSSRYHPVVFASAAAVPALALAVDPYTQAKLQAALLHVGRAGDVLWMDEALAGDLVDRGVSLLEADDRAARRDAAAGCRRHWEDHRAAVASILRGVPAVAPTPPSAEHVYATVRSGSIAMRRHGRVPDVLLHSLRVDDSTGDAIATMSVTDPLGTVPAGDISLRLHDARRSSVAADSTPFVPLAVALGLALRRGVRVDGAVDRQALVGARAAAALRAADARAPLALPTAAEELVGVDDSSAGRGCGVLCSSGLAATAILVRHRKDITHLVGIDWAEGELPDAPLGGAWRSLELAAAATDLHLLRVSTDARRVLDPLLSWDNAAGSVMAALAHLISPELEVVHIRSGVVPDRSASHIGRHELDALWSSSRTIISHANEVGGWVEMAALVASDPHLLRSLSVCPELPSQGNCGRCVSCLLALTSFHAAGCLDSAAPYFCDSLSSVAVSALTGQFGPEIDSIAQELIDALHPDDPLAREWASFLGR